MDFTTVNTLSEVSFIAGTTQIFEFAVVDNSGYPVDLGAATCSWKMSYFSNPTETVVSKSGTVFGTGSDSFRVTLTTADTQELYGKFIHQPVVIDFAGKEYRLDQGLITIRQRA
mgnify:CR=1 FL=1